MNSWSERDKKVIWHPFTHLKFAESEIFIDKTEGTYYFDQHGNKIIDAISSWWVNLHGHRNPHIVEKIKDQLQKNEHSIFSGFTHQGAIEFAERILTHLPANQSKIFYSDNGSTAVEVALKMCIQYWENLKKPKSKFIAFEGAYHGDTFGGMSVAERNAFNRPFKNFLFDVEFFPIPEIDKELPINYFSKFEELVSGDDIAGFIFEPLVQGAGGMKMMDEESLSQLIKIAKAKQVLCVADEVMTGFGRTGTFFATDQLSVMPEIICLSKGITGGFLPMGLTSCSDEIFAAFISDHKTNTFFHGHSYTANPLSIAAALGNLDLMEKKETWDSIERISKHHKDQIQQLRSHPSVSKIRCKGTIFALDLVTKEENSYLNSASDLITSFFIKKGILLRPLGNTLYVIPPYCISEGDLKTIYQNIKIFLDDFKI